MTVTPGNDNNTWGDVRDEWNADDKRLKENKHVAFFDGVGQTLGILLHAGYIGQDGLDYIIGECTHGDDRAAIEAGIDNWISGDTPGEGA